MRTLKMYATIATNLIKWNKKITKNALKFHNRGNPLRAYQSIDDTVIFFMNKIVEISGARVKATGFETLDKDETYLFVSNHQSNFDIPLLYTYSPIKMAFVAKQEMRKIPIMGKLMELRGHIFMNRDNPKDAVKSIQKGIEVLKSGASLAVFPEGSRSKGEAMGSFKPGALRLAIKSGVKVVPVIINGSYNLMEANNGRVKPADVEIKYLNPLDSKNYKDAVKLTEELEIIIKNELQHSQSIKE
ncbi:lysophospholipid acyltransferase family protein [Priestia megaterium]|uniref:1-acyl-sn-glycerol-3-phosphate acyltransferase n=1 Tax=Priestia megaterium TaxID=1404 RepID=A0A6M6E5H7_PRIMG|nr:lysophospholipid acyltransferase family protein [Priestia megaterium]QJX80774.1 1-acylglycerol-3-phosphate O-acyltransferase [Priestia megaterium]